MHGSSQRHSVEDRPPSKEDRHKASHHLAHGHPISQSHNPQPNREPLIGDKAEHLAERMVQVGADRLEAKAHQRYPDEVIEAGLEARTGAGAYPQSHSILSAKALADKIMKEAMKEMASEEAHVTAGIIFPGSEASCAQRVVAHKDDPSAREDGREVAEIVRQRIAHEMEVEEGRGGGGRTFTGPNPDAGRGGLTKNRRLRERGGVKSTGLRTEKSYDVL